MLNYQRVIEETELERTRECRYESVHDPRITMFGYLMIYDMHIYCAQMGAVKEEAPNKIFTYIISLRSH